MNDIKHCSICNKPVSFDEFLIKHIFCKTSGQKEAVNGYTWVTEAPFETQDSQFWEENKIDFLTAIMSINHELDERNIPLLVAETVCLSDDQAGWYFYICNKETEEYIYVLDGKEYVFSYPSEYPKINDPDIVIDMISKNELLYSLSEKYDNFAFYEFNTDNIKSLNDYEKEKEIFCEFLEDKKHELEMEELSNMHPKSLWYHIVKIFKKIWTNLRDTGEDY